MVIRAKLIDQLSELEARVDFEDELPPLNAKELLNDIGQVQFELDQLIKDSKRTIYYRNGLKMTSN